MSEVKKRPYKSTARNTQAAQTKARILTSARNLFESEGFEYVTIEKIAQGISRQLSLHVDDNYGCRLLTSFSESYHLRFTHLLLR